MRISNSIIIVSTVLLLIFQAAAGESLYPSGYNLSSQYSVNSNTIEVGDTLVIIRTVKNNDAFGISGLYFSENLPPQFNPAEETIKINGSDIVFKRYGPLRDLIRPLYDNYTWVIDDPDGGSVNNVLNPGDSIEFELKLICDSSGEYILPLHTSVFYGNNQGFLSTSDSIQIEIVLSSGTDTIPPEFVEVCPTDTTVECGAIPDPPVMTAVDNYDTDVNVVYDEVINGNIITRTWTATDNAGNSAQCAQTITVLDNTPPVIVCADNLIVDCGSSIDPEYTGYPIVTDNCNDSTIISYSDVHQNNIITRTWTATDNAGNSAQCAQTITVLDNTPPVIVCANNLIVDCGSSIDPEYTGYPTVTDNCNDSTIVSYSDLHQNNLIRRFWTATDNAGNSAQCMQTLVILDTTPPVIVCADNLVVDCGSSIDPEYTGYPTVTDNCNDSTIVSYSDVHQDNIITRTWTATDNAGNSAKCVQTITVLDTAPPWFTDGCPPDTTVECGAIPDPIVMTAIDSCDSSVDVVFEEITDDDNIYRTWTATDNAGNSAQCVQTITVLDTAPPWFTDGCPPDTTVEPDAIPDPPPMTAIDNCDPDVDVAFDEIDDSNIITRTWTATDNAGNSTRCVQNIYIDTGNQALSRIFGQVTADGIGLYNADVNLFDSDGDFLTDIAANEEGFYSFDDLPEGGYAVQLTIPLGYIPVTDTSVQVSAAGYEIEVSFDLTNQVVTNWYYHWWWWQRQFTYIQQGGFYERLVEVSPDEFERLSELIFEHIYNRGDGFEIQIDSVTYIDNPPRSIAFEELSDIFLGVYSNDIDASVKRSLRANLLNIASGRMNQYEVVSLDGATASQALTYLAGLYLTGGINNAYVAAVNLQRMHMGIMIAGGVIPLETPNIVYKGNSEAVPEAGITPSEFVLYQNSPNPFNPSAEIEFQLPRASDVKLEVYNITGQKVATLVDDIYQAGNHTATWDASGFSSGIYFYKLEADGFTESKKMLLLK